MDSDDKEAVVVMGAGAVGKSALVVRFTTDTFVEDYDPTLEDNYRKEVRVDNKHSTLDILDTAGQEEFKSMHDRWVKPASGIILVYSITNKETFEEVKELKKKISRIKDAQSELGSDYEVPILLVGNKCDLPDEREVGEAEGKELADGWESKFFETSAKTNQNVTRCFEELVREIRLNKAKVNDGGGVQETKKKGLCALL